jgi:Transposase IS116/IS110/IS902 family
MVEVGLEQWEQLAGEVALEQPQDLLGGLALGGAPLCVGAAGRVDAQSRQGDDPQGAVGLAVTATIQPMADCLARGDRHWTGAAQRGQGGVGSEPVGVVPGGDQQLAGGLDPDAAAGQQPRGGLAGQGDEVRVERGQLGGQDLVAAGQVAQGPVGGAGRVGAASGLLGQVFGISAVLAVKLIGHSGAITRFHSPDHYASYTGTAPIDASSGPNTRQRVNRGGNRALNTAIHLVARTQISRPGPGRTYYERKLAEGKTPNQAYRALKRQIVKVVYRALLADHHTPHPQPQPATG